MIINTLLFIQAAKQSSTDVRRHLVWRANYAKIFSVNLLDFGLQESTESYSNFKMRVYQLAIITYPIGKMRPFTRQTIYKTGS